MLAVARHSQFNEDQKHQKEISSLTFKIDLFNKERVVGTSSVLARAEGWREWSHPGKTTRAGACGG